MNNIKAFLEADALRTQGEWHNNSRSGKTNVQAENGRLTANAGGYMDNMSDGKYHYENEANANFIAAASRIPDEIRAMQDALEQVCSLMHDHADTLESWVHAVPERITKMMEKEMREKLAIAAPFRKIGV